MDKEKVRMIVRNMELLVQSLKHEIEEPPMQISMDEDSMVTPFTEDYDEVFS
jgi:hypothetical protein